MRIVYVDDEEFWRMEILSKLRTYFADDEVITFASGNEFIEADREFDIVFLDVEMEGKDGFETAMLYKAFYPDAIIMMLTSHREMVKKGYQVNAFRYLDKISIDEDLAEAVPAAIKLLNKNRKILLPIIHIGEIPIDTKDIRYVETEKRNTCIHTRDGVYICSKVMTEMEELLGEGFYRCHRSFIVNLDAVKNINRANLELKNGEMILLSVRKRAECKKKYLDWKIQYANL